MTNAVNPLFIFVPGILHTPAHFRPIATALQAKGYESFAVSLPNIGEGAPTAAPAEDARAVRKAVEHSVVSDSRNVILVCHSYGGIPGCQAVLGLEKNARQSKGEPGGVVLIIFLAAFIAQNNESALDALIRTEQPPPPFIELNASNNNVQCPNDLAGEYVFSDMDKQSQDLWAAELQPISTNHQTAPVENACWASEIPKMYIHATEDKALWLRTQKAMLEQVKDTTWSTIEMNSGHAPFLSQPDEFADLLIANSTIE